MKLTLPDTKLFRDSISIISELINEAKFTISSDGINLIAMDPANVAMVIYKLLPSAFTEYDIKETENIAVNLIELKQVLRRAGSQDVIILEKKDNKLKIQFKGTNTRTFSMPLLDLDDKEQKQPDLAFPISIETNANNLHDAIQDVDIVAESVTFVGDQKKLSINAEGDLSQANIELKSTEDTKITTSNEKQTKAKYSIEYLKKMIDGSKLSNKVTIRFSNDYPLKLEYKAIDKLALNFILAPRVEND